ncbi:unnamed protein product [Caenorhabditis angaria]|uniref:DUF7809 domain-containing protein n=1 Tax=Caenorhabditis angaria TaxID=860376 RepID=A0A9P1N349_9PELO|nr:unnamed protein product [Caenorhabditis angaria]
MGSNQLDVQWTNSMLLNVVENYVVRPNFSRFSDGEHFGDLQSKEVFNSKQALKIIKKLYEKDSGLSVYGPAEKLMEDLVTIQYFPNNAKFLGLTDEYNYFGYPRYLVDKSGGEFMSKMDVFMVIYRNFTNAYDDGNEIANLILMKWGNQIGKKLKTSFEIIPGCLVDAVISSCSDFYKNHANEIANGKLCRKFRFSKYNVDELYARFSKHFDESTDAHLLKQLKQQLTAYSKRVPIKVNQKFYQRVYIKLVLYEESTKHLLKQFPTIFTPNVPCFGDYNVATTRMLKDGDDTFFFAKELQEAVKAGFIDKYEGRKMPRDDTNIVVETNEERMNKGIIYTVSMDEFEKLLGKFKITNRDVSVIENDYKKTSRQIGVPLISPYGSHCKTATDAFFEVFDHISTGMKVFQAVSEENLPKVFEFFEKLPFIISNHQDKYMVTTAKIGESVDLAYQQLAQYVTEPIYELPKDKLLFTEDEAREEINKLSPNLPLNQENLKFVLFYRRKQVGGCRNLSIRDVFEVFEHCLRLQFFLLNPKFAEFMHNQRACQVYPRFQCHCFSKANKAPKSIRSLENLTASHVQAIHIKYNNTLRYQIFTNSAKKFYDNETCLQKSLDVSLDSVRGENRELISLIYEAQNIKLASEAKRFFYLSEFEMDGLVGQFAHRFVTGIKFSNDRLENQKDDLHQTTVIRWEEIHKSLRDFFPEQTKYEELFEKIKENLRNRKCAKGGIRGNYVSAIMDILRQAQMNFGRIWNTLKSLTDFQCWNPHRTIQLRILTAIRVDDQKTWHLFSEEVLEALKCVLRAEKRLHLVREKNRKLGDGMVQFTNLYNN